VWGGSILPYTSMATTNIAADIQNITGVTTANAQFLISAQKFVAASVPKNLLKWAATATVPGNHGGNTSDGVKITMPIGTDSILDVSRNGFSGTEVPYNMKGFIANTASLYLATNTYPKYYLDDANPGEGVRIIVKPIPTDSETAIALYVDFSKIDDDCDLRNAVIYKASSQEFEKLGSDELPTISISAVPPDVPSLSAISFSETNGLSITATAPTAISLATISYTDAVNSDASATAVGAITVATVGKADMDGNVPTYTKPSTTVTAVPPDVPTLSTVNFSETNALAITATDPTAITLTTVNYSAASATASTALASLTAPTYTKTSLQTARVSFKTFFEDTSAANPFGDSDPTAFSVSAVPPDVPTSPSFTTPGISTVTVGSLGTAPTYDSPTITASSTELTEMEALSGDALGTDADFYDFEKWFTALGEMIEDEEDTELAQAQIGKISTYIQAYSQAMQNQLNEFNEENILYQSTIQEAIQNAQIAAQEAQQEANLLLQKEQQEYSSTLQKYSAELQEYQAEVAAEVQEYGQKLQRYQLEVGNVYTSWAKSESDSLQEYQLNIQNELNEFNKDNAAFAYEIQKALADANATNQIAMQNGIQEAQDAIQNNNAQVARFQSMSQHYATQVNEDVQAYTSQLQGDVQQMQADLAANQNLLSKYQTEITEYQAETATELQVIQIDVQNELNEFNKDNVRYQANVQAELAKHNTDLQKASTQAQIDAADAQQEAAQTTDVDKFNKAQDQALDLANRSKQIEDDISNNNSKVAQFSAEAQHYATQVNEDVQAYTSQLQIDVQQMQGDVVTEQNKLAKYQAELVEYQAEVAAETAEYQNKIQKQQVYSKESDKYYQWANAEVQMYIQNNSKMISRNIAAQAATQQQRAD